LCGLTTESAFSRPAGTAAATPRTGTPADCPSCQICNGSVCVPSCSLSAASATLPAASQDELLSRIFAAQCTCDDHDECTINDRCDGKGGCTGDRVFAGRIALKCVVQVDTPVTVNVTSNAPERLDWAVPGAVPASGKGAPFDVTFPAPGEYTVTASCKSATSSTRVDAGFDCASIDSPTLDSMELPGTPSEKQWGVTTTTDHSAGYAGCVSGDKWCYRLKEFHEVHTFGTRLHPPAKDITGAGDSQIDATNCQRVLSELTPREDSLTQGVPTAIFVSFAPIYVVEEHERFHVDERKAEVLEPTLQDLAAFVSNSCTDCKVWSGAEAELIQQFNDEMERLWDFYLDKFNDGNEEARALMHENALLAELRQQIRARGRAEGWPSQCQ